MSARKLPQSDGVIKGVEYSHTEINRRFLKEGQGCHRKSQEWEPIRRITVSAAAFQMPTVSFILPHKIVLPLSSGMNSFEFFSTSALIYGLAV